jgi:hypothetical protein
MRSLVKAWESGAPRIRDETGAVLPELLDDAKRSFESKAVLNFDQDRLLAVSDLGNSRVYPVTAADDGPSPRHRRNWCFFGHQREVWDHFGGNSFDLGTRRQKKFCAASHWGIRQDADVLNNSCPHDKKVFFMCNLQSLSNVARESIFPKVNCACESLAETKWSSTGPIQHHRRHHVHGALCHLPRPRRDEIHHRRLLGSSAHAVPQSLLYPIERGPKTLQFTTFIARPCRRRPEERFVLEGECLEQIAWMIRPRILHGRRQLIYHVVFRTGPGFGGEQQGILIQGIQHVVGVRTRRYQGRDIGQIGMFASGSGNGSSKRTGRQGRERRVTAEWRMTRHLVCLFGHQRDSNEGRLIRRRRRYRNRSGAVATAGFSIF